MTEDIGAAVERIMRDPAFAGLVKELGGGDSADLMSRLPEVMKTIGPILGAAGETGAEQEREERKETEASPDPAPVKPETAAPVPVEVLGKKPFSRSNAEKLFLALKPYLGNRRRDMVDRCVSVMQMSELLKAAGIAGTGGGGEGSL